MFLQWDCDCYDAHGILTYCGKESAYSYTVIHPSLHHCTRENLGLGLGLLEITRDPSLYYMIVKRD